MKIYKFGGASVKDASAVRNLTKIISEVSVPLVVVVSAMGKTTNALERLVTAYFNQESSVDDLFNEIHTYHFDIVNDLFPENHKAKKELNLLFDELNEKIGSVPSTTFNFEYDQVVSYGELFSTTIINLYLNQFGILSEWIDVRKIIKTDSTFREAKVLFEESSLLALDVFNDNDSDVFITQGFLGTNRTGHTTTLGREGSDYTAALLAAFVNGESVTVWKDVPGVLNADPKWFDDTEKLEQLTYTDAIELAFYGASVLHPKTIQPIKQKGIPLYVRSFIDYTAEGTVIGEFDYKRLIPSFIFKVDQVLINIHPENLSFIAEENLERIFSVLAKYGLRVNLMQNTAVSFRLCVNNDTSRIPDVLNDLKQHYQLSIEDNLELITIRYYDQDTIRRVLVDKEVLLEQHSNKTVQMVVRKKN